MKSTLHSEEQVFASLSKHSENVLQHHLHSFGINDLEALMSDYTEQSVLVTRDQTCKGLGEIRAYFTELMSHFPKERSNFILDKLVVRDELVFIVWHATTPTMEVLLGTDTFIIKHGKIHQQTFAGQLNLLN